MTRVKGGTVARARRKKVLKEAKGYFGSKHRLFKTAHEQVMHSGVYAFRDRKQNKRNFRKLWITRLNAGCRENEISYSRSIDGLDAMIDDQLEPHIIEINYQPDCTRACKFVPEFYNDIFSTLFFEKESGMTKV